MQVKKMNRRQILTSLSLMALTPAVALPEDAQKLMQAFTAGKAMKQGLIVIEMNDLVENGNSVALRVKVNHPQTAAAFIKRIGIFNEKNPQSDVAVFQLTPFSGKAEVATRIRLATTQSIHVVAESSEGIFYYASCEAIVTLAACLEE
jgi:sulfur-oxidizing protein SoxY